MSNVLNRTTKQYLLSVNTPDFPESEWLINPDMDELKDVPPDYLIIEDDTVREATAAEKETIDFEKPLPEPSELDKIKLDIKNIFAEIEALKKQ